MNMNVSVMNVFSVFELWPMLRWFRLSFIDKWKSTYEKFMWIHFPAMMGCQLIRLPWMLIYGEHNTHLRGFVFTEYDYTRTSLWWKFLRQTWNRDGVMNTAFQVNRQSINTFRYFERRHKFTFSHRIDLNDQIYFYLFQFIDDFINCKVGWSHAE